jgi:hypothetical protein
MSWYRLGRVLPASETTVANWKNGRTTIDRKFVTRIAELLEESPEYVLLCLEAEREQSVELRKLWRRIAERFRSTTASVLLTSVMLVSGVGSPTPAEAHERSVSSVAVDRDIHYAQLVRHSLGSRRLMRCLKTLAGLPLRFAVWTRARISSTACPSRCFAY